MTEKKYILVTGSSGFIGKHLVKSLREQEYVVYEFDHDQGDIADFKFQFTRLDHIVHLASLIFIPASWDNPQEFYRTNVMGVVNVLETCRKYNCSLTYISSYVYGTPQYLPVDENHPVNPSSPYNHSKLIAEDVCRFYSEAFHIPVTIFRPVNVYGPGQRADFLIPKIIAQALDQAVNAIEVMDLRPKRDYLYVDDFIDAVILSFSQQKFDIFNISSGHSVSVEDIILTILRESGCEKPYSAKNIERPNEIWDVYADHSKLSSQMNWSPKTSFEKGIEICISALKKAMS
jgi:nucleoside-diphosphate-sugar epimerase